MHSCNEFSAADESWEAVSRKATQSPPRRSVISWREGAMRRTPRHTVQIENGLSIRAICSVCRCGKTV